MPPIVRLMRPHQYTKNLLIFAAPGAAGRLDEWSVLAQTIWAFVLFCAVSSAGYVANDLADVEVDRLHPTKQRRPIASGDVSPETGQKLFAGLFTFALVGSASVSFAFTATLLGYALLTFVYSNMLKRVPWVELIAVSAGFLLRAVAGGAATSTSLSWWFLLVVSAGALLVITGKRLGELLTLGSGTPTRPVLGRYNTSALRGLAAASAVFAVTGYAAWAASEASNRSGDDAGELFLQLTAFPFAVAIGRYLKLCWDGKGEAPDLLVLRDPIVIMAGLVWIVLYAIGLYR